MSKKILCIGDVILDIIPSPFPIDKNKILQDGETFVNNVTFQKGGCAGNFSCIMKSIYPQADVVFVSRIGAKPYGDFLIKEIKKYNVVPVFTIDETVSTQITIAVSYKEGDRHFITYLGALEKFSIEDIPEDIFNDVDHVAFRGIWFAEKLLFQSEKFLKIAQKKGIPVSMDIGFDPFWNRMGESPELLKVIQKRKKYALKALKYVKFLFGNEEEFMQLTDKNNIDDAISFLLQQGIKNIIIHQGAKGSLIVKPFNAGPDLISKKVKIPSIKVDIVNPVGSGDTFDSILIASVIEGKTLVEAATFATAGAAYMLKSLPGTKIDLKTVEKFIDDYPELKK